eukprot:2250755-Amphidinium_carterae.2
MQLKDVAATKVRHLGFAQHCHYPPQLASKRKVLIQKLQHATLQSCASRLTPTRAAAALTKKNGKTIVYLLLIHTGRDLRPPR